MPEYPKWILLIRKFIATDRKEFLNQAIEACNDEEISAFLSRADVSEGFPNKETSENLTEKLISQKRESEAAIVEILKLRSFAYAAENPLGVPDDQSDLIFIFINTCAHLMKISEMLDFKECEARFARTMGTGLKLLHKWDHAENLLKHAAALYFNLIQTDSETFLPEYSPTLNNLGNVLMRYRKFDEALLVHREALEIERKLAEKDPDIQIPHVAASLNNLGNVLSQIGRYEEAQTAFIKSLEIRRKLAEKEPDTYLPLVARTLNNLSSVLSIIGKPDEAQSACREALEIRRKFAEKEPDIYLPLVAQTLCNFGTILRIKESYKAISAYKEALKEYSKLAEKKPEIYMPDVAGTLNNLSLLSKEIGKKEDSLHYAQEAVRIAESIKGNLDLLFLSKGKADGAYNLIIHHFAETQDYRTLFRYLSTRREGHVCATHDNEEHSLESTRDVLRQLQTRLKKNICLLIAQRIGENEAVLDVIYTEGLDNFKVFNADHFLISANALFYEVVSVFNDGDARDPATRKSILHKLASDAFSKLPDFAKELLHPQNGNVVLISGDGFWNAFPWETLCFGDGEKDWLGLHHPLPRWGPLTARALNGIKVKPFGNNERTATVICPWNAVIKRPLAESKKEAEQLASAFVADGYRFLPNGSIASGNSATRQFMSEIITNAPSIIHYTGHGDIINNEEVLIMHGGSEDAFPSIFGRSEITIIKEQNEIIGNLLKNGPLVVLNCCMAGLTKAHGGQREDLPFTFLNEGAEAVIASPLPVFDELGSKFGRWLYSRSYHDSRGMAWSFAKLRTAIANHLLNIDSPRWAAWTLLQYHGNPFAFLPYLAGNELKLNKAELSEIADDFNLNSADEAQRMLDDIRGQIN